MTDGATLRAAVLRQRATGQGVGLVPTMGALHAGHLSLVEAARRDCDFVVVSVFVNPTQFAPGEDLERYPRNLDRDRALLAEVGCDVIFAPSARAIYPPGSETVVDVGSVAKPWEGAARPTHFRGVATVVLKLFHLAPADRAFFGQKDYQQTVVVRRMIEDLNVPIELVVCPIVREEDGLAMSSRNAYLSPAERRAAVGLSASLRLAERMAATGERSVEKITAAMLACIEEAAAEAKVACEVQYTAALRPGTVEEVTTLAGPTVFAIAARVGETRLIDNAIIG